MYHVVIALRTTLLAASQYSIPESWFRDYIAWIPIGLIIDPGVLGVDWYKYQLQNHTQVPGVIIAIVP